MEFAQGIDSVNAGNIARSTRGAPIVKGGVVSTQGHCAQHGGAGRASAHPAIVRPPDTLNTWPVMNAASSLARKHTAPTTSSGCPSRPNGIALVGAPPHLFLPRSP